MYYALGIEADDVKDFNLAEKYFNLAVANGVNDGLIGLADVANLRNDYKLSFELATKAFDAGVFQTAKLAGYYRGWKNVAPINKKKYIQILKTGAARGDGKAARWLGDEYSNGDKVGGPNKQMAMKYYARGVELYADGEAAGSLGRAYYDMYLDKEDTKFLEEATKMAIFGAKLGDGDSINLLFDLMESGNAKFKNDVGPDKSFDKFELVKVTAEKGDANAQFKLAKPFEELSTAKSDSGGLADAINWYRKAAEMEMNLQKTH